MTAARPRVVVVGAGFGGLACVQALARTPVEITLIDRRNHHLFQRLLDQVAIAALSPADIAWPSRAILRGQRNVEVQLGRVTNIDRKRRLVLLEAGRMLPFDMLVVATGARHAYFSRNGWEAVAPGLKRIDDATLIRQRVVFAFERAEASDDDSVRRALLTFVVMGGGPTGVEMAGAVVDLGRVRFSGLPAWLFWAVAHGWFLIGGKNRFAVGTTWAWSHLSYDRGARLITGASGEALGPMPDPVHAVRRRDPRSAA